MKTYLIRAAVLILTISFFSECEKDKFAEIQLNPLDPKSDSLVFEITNGSYMQSPFGYYDTHLNFAFYSPDIVPDKKKLKFVLYRNDILVDSTSYYTIRYFDNKIFVIGKYKYEIALDLNGLYSKKSKPFFIDCK